MRGEKEEEERRRGEEEREEDTAVAMVAWAISQATTLQAFDHC